MSTGSPSNQTLSYIHQRLKAAGIRPDGHKGQNFLVDLNLVRLLASSADLSPDDVVLEVGTGSGSLTSLMAPVVAHVVTVEIDPNLHQLARESLVGQNNITLLRQDALKNKNNLHPSVWDEIRKRLAEAPGRRFKLVANLPYNIATPVITNLLAGNPTPDLMVFTVQKEVGDRLLAKPGHKDYSSLSIWVQSQCDVSLVRVLSPSVFWPRPKVHSAIMRLDFRPEKRAKIADLEFFHQFVRSMFFHRRKFLRSVLISAVQEHLNKEQVDEILRNEQLDPTLRAEALDIEQMHSLTEAVRHAIAVNEPEA